MSGPFRDWLLTIGFKPLSGPIKAIKETWGYNNIITCFDTIDGYMLFGPESDKHINLSESQARQLIESWIGK